jgi:hypothetical protein
MEVDALDAMDCASALLGISDSGIFAMAGKEGGNIVD